MIKVQDLTYCYGGQTEAAIANIDLEVQDGEFVLITGPSGSGKSSLGRCFNGLIPHFYGGRISGAIIVQGLDVLKSSTAVMAARVGMVFQDPENQIVSTSVEREIAFGLENLAFAPGLIARRIEESLDSLGIFNLRRRPIAELSGGEKQKVAIASILALHPEVLVLDEPTSELDPQSAEDVLSIIKRLNEDLGITVILIEHRLDRLLSFVDRLVIMEKGRVTMDGSIRRLLDEKFAAITRIGIGAPPVVRLAKALENSPVRLSTLPLTVKEGRRELENAIRSQPPKLFVPQKTASCEPIIRVEKITFTYPGGGRALKNISLEIYEGEFVAIMGRNSSGKSTLVRHFNGLLKPAQGRVMVDGEDTRRVSVAGLARKTGFVFQNPDDHLFSDTVESEIGFAMRNFGCRPAEIKARVDDTIARLGLESQRLQYPRSLSGGEKQRVALASVLAARPRIMVLDEPTRGLQQGLKEELMELLRECTRQGCTVVLVSHDVETVAEYADRVILMSEGELVAAGSKYDVLSRALLFSPQINRLVQSFVKQGLAGEILTPRELAQVML